MNITFNRLLTATLLSSAMLSPSAMALNIVLTNDDSWRTQNIQNLKSALESAGHSVVMSAPCGPQSGKGGSMIFMKSVPVDDTRSSKICFVSVKRMGQNDLMSM
ncbi:5'/3'-nucleotidase SurE [Vibrio gangliei]|uniref:5'/3'-nucleotidase SurE n=1 Tax=Vibrio gangliei TaxID=2077090 RepID=UPI00222FC5FA|nr:5'/3'-nucleotidase SurE [Vibrio gangliei]